MTETASIQRLRWLIFVVGLGLFGVAYFDTEARAERRASAPAIDFDTQIVPVLTRQGCNAGACHGAAAGRGGFKLSLFGSDAESDYNAIVRELEGRRINLTEPDFSLLLRKASETISHGGGLRLEDGTDAYELVRSWIAQGAQRVQSRQLVELAIEPQQALVASPGEEVEIEVTATFDDGHTEDVTAWTVLTSDDAGSLEVDEDGRRLIVKRRGEHVAIARYLDQVKPIRVALPFLGGSDVAVTRQQGVIDHQVNAQLSRLGIPASPQSDDYEFARRVWLDLAGRLPTPQEVTAFVADSQSNKRQRLIDRLLDSEDFANYWALKWANVLAIDSKKLQPEGAAAYHQWIRSQFLDDKAWDEAAFEMVTATGDAFEQGEVNFLRSGDGPDGLAEYASRVFMGVRLRCANCHNHPLDRWQQDDYHGLAAVFAKLSRGQIVTESPRGEVTHPVTGEPAVPKIPGDLYLAENSDARAQFARWLTNPDNGYLARATVNRIWRQLMGRGLIEPVDDIRATNPASHPKLLEELAKDFAQEGFRFKPLIRQICLSEAYGRSAKTVSGNEADQTYYSHALRRQLEAEVIADAIGDVTGVPMKFTGTRDAIELTNNRITSASLDILGRCDRSMACESPQAGTGSLSRALHFLNGELINERLSSEACFLTELMGDEGDDLVVADRLYLRTLTRPMNDSEGDFWSRQIKDAKAVGNWQQPSDRRAFFEDLLWSLMTSDAFLTNH